MVEISNHSGTFSGAKFNEKVDEFLGIQFAHAERFQAPIDIEKYYEKEIDDRVIKENFNFSSQTKENQEVKTKSLNDRLTSGISFGLNDRIAFEKKLFGGSTDDYNRVLSQLNTFESFDEAKGFIEDFVKPDYNNWDGKEEFENRFLEFIERKFS